LYKAILICFSLIFQDIGQISAQDVQPVRGGQLRLGYVLTQDPQFNPMIARTEYEHEINRLIFGDGLLRRAKEVRVVQGLVASINIYEQSRKYRVSLRSNLYFHDGSRITSEDVKFTFDLYKKFALQSPLLFDVRLISAVNIEDEKTLTIILKEPYPKFRTTIGLLPILSKKRYENWLSFNLLSSLPYIPPLGNGEYEFKSYISNQIDLDAHKNHYRGRSNLDGITMLFYSTYEEMLDAFIQGQIDVMAIQNAISARKIRRLTPSTKIESVHRDHVKLYYILLNTKKSPFNDINIRRVFNYGVYKKQLTDKILGKDGQVAYNLFDEKSASFFSGTPVYRYDPLQSLDILRSSGYRRQSNGKLFQNNREFRFDFYYSDGSSFEESIARMISINLGELGINILPKPIIPEDLNERVNQGKFQAALRSFIYDPENPAQALRGFYLDELKTEDGFRNFNSRVLNTAVSQIEKATNSEQIDVIMQQMQVQINQLSPCIYLFLEDQILYAIDGRFENVTNTIYQNLKNVRKINPKDEWYIPKQKQKN